MLPICQVCLRTDKQLQTVEENLENWLDELCGFAIKTTVVQFCAECAHLLRKYYYFKEKCLRASKVLSSWLNQNERNRKPLSQLSKQMPVSSIGLAKESNCKIYLCQSADLNTPDLNVIQELNSDNGVDKKYDVTSYKIPNMNAVSEKYRPLITIDGTRTNNTQNQLTVNENQRYNQQSCKNNQPTISIYQEDSQSSVFTHVDKETVKLEIDEEDLDLESIVYEDVEYLIDDDDDSNIDSQFNIKQLLDEADMKANRDSGVDEGFIKKKHRETDDLSRVNNLENQMKPNAKKCNEPFNIEMLKEVLSSRFASCGEVKDKEGNVIEKDCIINSLDKLQHHTLTQIKKRVKDSNTLTPKAIRILSRVQKEFGDKYSSVFTTEHLLTLEDEIAEFNQRQNYECYVKAEFKCKICFSGFKHRKMLDYHLKMFHNMSLPHPCSLCEMRFKTKHNLMKHRSRHKTVFKCKLCPLVTNYRSAMENHYHQHMGKIYKCTLCVNTFKSRSCLNTHMINAHQSQHICSFCARTFISDAGLAQHKSRKHGDESPPSKNVSEEADTRTCDECKITFISDQVYQRHLRRSHKIEVPGAPGSCVYKKRFRSAPAPGREPNYICRVCKTLVHSLGRLKFHFYKEHPSVNFELCYSDVHKYLCHICGKGYSWLADLNEHKHLHTGEKPYACDKCPKTFHRKINLRNHQEWHLPPSRECPTCGKKFVTSANLHTHIKLHIGVRHYTCELCGKSFLHRSSLNEHVRGVHHHIRRQRKQAKPTEQ